MSEARDEFFRLLGSREARNDAQTERNRMVAMLLRGQAQIFGERVVVTFPDAQPFGLSNSDLADLADLGPEGK